MCGYVRTRLSFSVIRSQTLLLRGERANTNTWRRRGALDGVAAGRVAFFVRLRAIFEPYGVAG
eukprot:scaffold281811_cov142-Cyclotella_meneghiniana.AAC.1